MLKRKKLFQLDYFYPILFHWTFLNLYNTIWKYIAYTLRITMSKYFLQPMRNRKCIENLYNIGSIGSLIASRAKKIFLKSKKKKTSGNFSHFYV